MTRLGAPLLSILRQEVLARCLAALARSTRVEFSTIGSDITALGAAAVLLHEELGIWPFRRVPAVTQTQTGDTPDLPATGWREQLR